MKGALCYIIQETKDSPLYLCAIDHENGECHRFPISVAVASRLGKECSAAVHSAITGYSEQHAFREVAGLLSKKFGET